MNLDIITLINTKNQHHLTITPNISQEKYIYLLPMEEKIKLFMLSCKNNDTTHLWQLMQYVDPSMKHNEAIWNAARNQKLDVVRILLKHPKVDPSIYDNSLFRDACSNGHIEIVKLLIEHPKVDITARNNEAICFASCFGRIDVVELLLKYPQVKPIDGLHNSVMYASRDRRIAVLKLLLKDDRVIKSLSKKDYEGYLFVSRRYDENKRF